MLLLTPVILRCFLALTVLLGPLASLRGRHSLYAGLEAPAVTLLDGSLLVDSWMTPVVFELGSYAAGNFTATVLSKPVLVFHCTAPYVPPLATRTTAVVFVAGTGALSDPSVVVKNDWLVRVERNVPFLAAILAAFAALFVGGTLLSGRMQVLSLERKRAALQTKVDAYTRSTLRRAADVSAIQAQYACEHASLIQLEQSVAALVADLEVAKTSLEHAEASKHLADERSINLCKVFDALLEREQVAEESHVQEVAWFGEQYDILNSQRASSLGQRFVEQVSTEIVVLEQTLEGCKTKLHLSEVREQEQLDAIDSLKQEVERTETDGSALLRDKVALELTCLAAQDRLLALRAKHGQIVDEFGTKLGDIAIAIAQTNDLADAGVARSSALQIELREVQEAASHLQIHNASALKVARERIDELNASTVTTDVEIDELRQINVLIETELPARGEDADAFEELAAKMEAENDGMESLLAQDEIEDDLWCGVLAAERDDLLEEQVNARKESQHLSKDVEGAQLSTAATVSAIKASQGDAEQHHMEQSTMLEDRIASNSTTIDDLAIRLKALKASFAAREAQYSARLDEFTQAEDQCAQDIEDTMFLTREAAFDAQQYESLGIEAIRKQREAEDNAARAVKRADKAQARSVAAEKEMRVSKCAFSTQVKDVEAQCASLVTEAEDLKHESSALITTNMQLAAEVARQESEFERKAAPLRSRLTDAVAGLYVFDTVQADIEQRMDAHLNTMQAHREKLQGNIQEYGSMIDTADEAIAGVVREREEEEDAQSAAEGQAEALTLLLFSPRSHGAGTPALSFASTSGTSSPTSPVEVPGTPQDHEVIFDASLGELDVEAGILVESVTVKALVPSNVGLGLLL